MTASQTETRSFIDMAGHDGPRLPQLPGLDGLRGLAVVAVVLYHVGFEGMIGGFLGVSTFFTLSGFLITSLLLNESRRVGRPDLRRFWSRRFRRLMPAALMTLALVSTVFARLVATADQRVAMRGDVLGSLFYVANWRFIFGGSTYGATTSSPSPLLHFWSLSIEEQFYILFPLLILALWKFGKQRRGLVVAVLTLLAALSASLPFLFSMSVNSAYLGSESRAAEMFIGGALAVILSYSDLRRRLALRYRPRVTLLVVASVCALVQLYWWWFVPQTSAWLYRGGLLLYAAMTCVIITAAALPIGPFRRVLALGPLRWLGTRSYGIYLFHWPLLLAFRQLRPEWGKLAQSVPAVVVACLIAEASFKLLEQPIRLGRWPSGRAALRTASVAVLAVSVIACVPLPIDKAQLTPDFDAALREFNAPRSANRPAPTSTTKTPEVPPAVARVAIFGDSTALLTGLGLGGATQSHGTTKLEALGGDVELGCGVSRFAMIRHLNEAPPMPQCLSWQPRWTDTIHSLQPDIAQLITGAWEVTDVKLPAGASITRTIENQDGTKTTTVEQVPQNPDWTSIEDPLTADFIRAELTIAVDTLSSTGAMVLIYLWPDFAPWSDDHGKVALDHQARPERMERLHEIMREIAASHPESVRILDLPDYLGPERLADKSLRPDGLHISGEKMTSLFTGGLADRVYAIWADWWKEKHQ